MVYLRLNFHFCVAISLFQKFYIYMLRILGLRTDSIDGITNISLEYVLDLFSLLRDHKISLIECA